MSIGCINLTPNFRQIVRNKNNTFAIDLLKKKKPIKRSSDHDAHFIS